MQSNFLESSIASLVKFCESADYKGYDPYDILNSSFNFKRFGKLGPSIAIQIQKRNPFNFRSILGIKKEINPKAMGLFLKAYCILFKYFNEERFLKKADYVFEWLKTNHTQGFSGYAWGYNFDWASPGSYLKAYTPSVVVTSFVIDGIYEYYLLTQNDDAKTMIHSSAKYIVNDIPITRLEEGISFSYTHLSRGCCYNASLLAAEILAKADYINNSTEYRILIEDAVKFVLIKQKLDGSWFYSFNPDNLKERRQIDFHQGFILVSLQNILELTGTLIKETEFSIKKGLSFYKQAQFLSNGRSIWRLPRKWPIDIHNQSQGIITFSRLKHYNPEYLEFAQTIVNWTINNMQSPKGYFYFRKTPLFINRIAYIRWAQAWMMLALAEHLKVYGRS